jgi:asparagine synthase (glutamine-hydrolysing)
VCGIAGVLNVDGAPVPSRVIDQMGIAVAHRGRDGSGSYVEGPVGLAHRRLAIIDLSPAAQQPMADEFGNFVLVYNGEVYNYRELRLELEAQGHQFHSQADSEVVVHAYEAWGDDSILRFNGMFAFALWDRKAKTLLLARDRFGVKPLYWHMRAGSFVFGSEIKAILEHPSVSRSPSLGALDQYFTFQNVYTDETLFEGIRLLPPAHTLSIRLGSGEGPRLQRYWDYEFRPDEALTQAEAAGRVRKLFQNAVARQLVSDVPVGAYLSGGLDSSSITRFAAGAGDRLRTFTGGFDLSSAAGLELGFDERPAAEATANLLKTEHYEVVMHAGDMEAVLPELIWHLEDLRIGQSYPNYYVARLASKFVKVVLSGAGGDELFAGYPWRYFTAAVSGRDRFLRQYYPLWQRLVADAQRQKLFRPQIAKQIDPEAAFAAFSGVFASYQGDLASRTDALRASLYFELKTFLPGLLVVEDKLSMAHGLETRVPFLDNELVDFVLTIPVEYSLRDYDAWARVDENDTVNRRVAEASRTDGKAVFRAAMKGLLPGDTRVRPKQGFAAPDASWFRGESIDYIRRVFVDPRAMLYEFLDRRFVQGVIDEHSSGRANRRLLIWSLLSFEWWCREFISGAAQDRARPPFVRAVA